MCSAAGRKVRPAVLPAATSSGVLSRPAPITPTFTRFTSNTLTPRIHGGALPVAEFNDLNRQEGEGRPALLAQQPRHAVVELVVAVGGRVEAPGVLDIDRRHVLKQQRVGR